MILNIDQEQKEKAEFLRGIETCIHLKDYAGIAEWLDLRCNDIVQNANPLRERSDSYIYQYTRDLNPAYSKYDYISIVIHLYASDPEGLKNRIHVKVRNFNGRFKSIIIHKDTYITAMYMNAIGLTIEDNKFKKLQI